MRDSFARGGVTAITGASTHTALHGLGGIGKTRAAIEYGHAHRESYSALLFVIGKSAEDLPGQIAALTGAAVLDLPEQAHIDDIPRQVASVKRWLRSNPGWLPIIDNVDNEAAARAVEAFLAEVHDSGGHVLITTRVRHWCADVVPLEIRLLSLALVQAGAYIQERRISFPTYARLLEAQQARLLANTNLRDG